MEYPNRLIMEDRVRGVVGRVHIVLRSFDGIIKDERVIDNLVVNSGRTHIAQLLNSNPTFPVLPGAPQMSHIAIGTDGSGLSATNTTLASELSRVSMNGGFPTVFIPGIPAFQPSIVLYEATWPATVGSGTIKEAGIFNASSGGTMLARTTFGVITKVDDDTLSIDWQVYISV